ncbi:MAG: prepilin peptidase [Candidatus Baltobacteraceae bacterium]
MMHAFVTPAVLFGAFFFAAAAYLGVILGNTFADRLPALADGPAPHDVPLPALLAVSALIGAIVIAFSAQSSQILMIAIVCVCLAAIWVTDARRGIVPDVFTLGPLAIVLAVGLWKHEWLLFLSAAVPFVPFAFAATLSKGRGMGWGDVKLVALGGAVLGAQLSVLAFALACLAAVAINYSRGRRRGIIAFAPYLATSIALALPLGMFLAAWR